MSGRTIRVPRVTVQGLPLDLVTLAVPGWGDLTVVGSEVQLELHSEAVEVVEGLADGEVMSRFHDALVQTADCLRHRSELLLHQAEEVLRSLRLMGVVIEVGDDDGEAE